MIRCRRRRPFKQNLGIGTPPQEQGRQIDRSIRRERIGSYELGKLGFRLAVAALLGQCLGERTAARSEARAESERVAKQRLRGRRITEVEAEIAEREGDLGCMRNHRAGAPEKAFRHIETAGAMSQHARDIERLRISRHENEGLLQASPGGGRTALAHQRLGIVEGALGRLKGVTTLCHRHWLTGARSSGAGG